MFVRESAYREQLARWGLDELPAALAFPAQLGPPAQSPRWRRVAGGNNDRCYRLCADADQPDWQFRTLYLKQLLHDPPTWRYLLRPSRFAHEAKNLALLSSLGLHCPRVVALGESRQPGAPATNALFGLYVAAVVAGLMVLLVGGFIWWIAGPRYAAEVIWTALLIGGAGLGMIVLGGVVVGVLRLLNRDYLVGAAMILTAIEPSEDLARFARYRWKPPDADRRLRNVQIALLSRQLATQVAVVHRHRLVHGDLKFRNLLVCWPRDGEPAGDNLRLAWIDCPQGRRLPPGPWLTRGRVKDLANLDRNASRFLSRAQRVRFLRDYLLAYGGEASLGELRRLARRIARYNRRQRD